MFRRSSWILAAATLAPAAHAQCWSETARLHMMLQGPQEEFGFAVAVSGDTALIGVPREVNNFGSGAGSVVFHERDLGGPGAWERAAKVIGSQVGHYAYFGWAVDLEGERAVVGAPGRNAAFVLERKPGGGPGDWREVARVVPGSITQLHGRSISLSGDTMIVGAPGDSGQGIGQGAGAVFVYERGLGGPGVWGEAKKLFATPGAKLDEFGNDVALSGDTAVVSAPGDGNLDQGAFYVFERDLGGPGNWGLRVKVKPFGPIGELANVALEGDTLLVGARAYLHNDGDARIFERDLGGPNAWGERHRFQLAGQTNLGIGVALSGPRAIVVDSGIAHVFERDRGGPNAWQKVASLTTPSAGGLEEFGEAVSLDGATAVLGAPREKVTFNGAGAAYVFDDPAAAVAYCAPVQTASTCIADLTACGTPSASAPSGFTVTASGVEGNSSGLFYFSSNGRQALPFAGATGLQCVTPPVLRGGVLPKSGVPGTCAGLFSKDLNARWCPTCPKPGQNPGPGATVQMQFMFRGGAHPSTAFTHALEFVVAP